ncbi:hypothetical protein J3D47_004078 [Pseudomonas laurylsulfativorans]|uniref:hypothetical protein n=1 Tax=Pseudomonas laurylsulfativorans TaxID=1943631 RepID=UPI003F591C09|nr:hypothetical protein [Pseudomonas laurylsulfativorans]
MERVFSAGIFGLLPIALLDGFSARWDSWVMLALQFGAAIGTLLLNWVMDRLAEHQKAEEAKAEAQSEQIRKEELKRIEDEAKAKQVVEPVAEHAPVVMPEPVKPATVTQAAPKPVAATAQTPLSLQAEVFDLAALVQAVAVGQVPISQFVAMGGKIEEAAPYNSSPSRSATATRCRRHRSHLFGAGLKHRLRHQMHSMPASRRAKGWSIKFVG